MIFFRLFAPILLLQGMLFSSHAYQVIKNWKYIPIDESLYSDFINNKQDPHELIKRLLVISKKNPSSLVGAEAQALISRACLSIKWFYCTYHFSLEVASSFPGSMPAYLAISNIQKLLETVNFYDMEVETLFSKGGYVEIPEESLPMVNYYNLRNNLRQGFYSWAKRNRSELGKDNFWFERYMFLKAIELVKEKKFFQAQDILNSVLKNSKNYSEFNSRAAHQLARLKFEIRDYEGAEEIYSKLITSQREYGRALMERAWIRYFKRDFAVPLGMIHSLKSPSLVQSQHPDQYKLQIMILRDLCYFNEVINIADEFRKKYLNAFTIIESGKDLSESSDLLNLVFQKAEWLPWAELISQLRLERSEIKEKFYNAPEELAYLLKTYEESELQFRTQVKALLKEPLESVARELLETREQVNLLEYLASLDKIRPKEIKQKVTAQKIENFAIEKIFWPQTQEFWRSEMNNIKVLISDRCQGDPLK